MYGTGKTRIVNFIEAIPMCVSKISINIYVIHNN